MEAGSNDRKGCGLIFEQVPAQRLYGCRSLCQRNPPLTIVANGRGCWRAEDFAIILEELL